MEDRTRVKPEGMRARIKDRHAQHVGGQQVAGELDARVVQTERTGERLRQRRLPNAGNVLDEQMASGEQASQRKLERGIFADDNAAKLGEHRGETRGDRHRAGLTGGTERHGWRYPKSSTIVPAGYLVITAGVALHSA